MSSKTPLLVVGIIVALLVFASVAQAPSYKNLIRDLSYVLPGGSWIMLNLDVTGDVTAAYFYGDGSHLTGISGGGSCLWEDIAGTATYNYSAEVKGPLTLGEGLLIGDDKNITFGNQPVIYYGDGGMMETLVWRGDGSFFSYVSFGSTRHAEEMKLAITSGEMQWSSTTGLAFHGDYVQIGAPTFPSVVSIYDLEGTFSNGEAYVCVHDNGTIFAKDSACA